MLLYPLINQTNILSIPLISVEEPSSFTDSPIMCKESTSIYPIISESTAPNRIKLAEFSGEAELLSEAQLLDYYKNEQLDFVDDFVDVFIEVSCFFKLKIYLRKNWNQGIVFMTYY